jgi:small subunit ribosomal protein S1
VLDVNEEKRRVSLGMKQMTEDPWIRAIPEKYIPGHIIKGKVAKLTNFGAFVELEPDLEGLLHISELADHKIDKPQDVVQVGQEVEVKILKVDSESRKIGLSLRRVQWAAEEQGEDPARRRRPAAVQNVLSDSDVERLSKPKGSAASAGPETADGGEKSKKVSRASKRQDAQESKEEDRVGEIGVSEAVAEPAAEASDIAEKESVEQPEQAAAEGHKEGESGEQEDKVDGA